MLNQIFNSVFSNRDITISPSMFALSILTSLLLGLLLAKIYKYKTIYTKEFIITLATLPVLISMIIFLVNGNLGTSVAVAGTFGLIRFRSAAGGAKEILYIFFATAVGIATGMGFLVLAILFTLTLTLVLWIYENSGFSQVSTSRRQATFIVPNNEIDYIPILEKILNKTCREINLISVKNINKNNTIQMEYHLDLKPEMNDIGLINSIMTYNPDIEVTLDTNAKKKKIL